MERHVTCCIAGGGPAGMMLGVLLARAGIDILVLEKHRDFLRDFRGDTIHPSTLGIMDELGWLDEFLTLPHQKVPDLVARFGKTSLRIADFSHLPVKAPYIAMMPQWDFLEFLARKGKAYPHFKIAMQTQATGLVIDADRVTGVAASGHDGPLTIGADLVVAADGRSSTLRPAAGFIPQNFGAPMDVLWFSLPRQATDTAQTQARLDAGRIFIMLNRGDYWQCAFVIPKDGDTAIRAQGLAAFQSKVAALLPFDGARANDIASLDDVKLLRVQVDRLAKWCRPAFLCIGDAAHAMSPVGGVGINLAIQDAVASANILAEPLREKRLTLADLEAVQARRDFPTRLTQRMQLTMQNAMIAPVLASTGNVRPPLLVRLIAGIPGLNRLPARAIGLGVRPEHVSQAIRAGRG